jgi:hypothetical protein
MFFWSTYVLGKLNHGDGWCEMPQGHNAMGGVWEDAQMVSPSLLPVAAIHQGEANNPSSVTGVVDLVHCDRPIVRNDVGHVCQAAMLRPDDVTEDDRNRSAR